MDKIAVISDVHGNLEALKAVLADIKERKINEIICLGDTIAKGTHQQECVELIKQNCSIVLRGNCDEYFTSDIELSNLSKKEIARINWNKSKLSSENINYLQNLPFSYEFYMSGRLIRLFHAHPEKNDKIISNIDSIDKLYELFLPSANTISSLKADVVIYGHIHVPYMQKLYNRILINTGSVGNAIDIIREQGKDGHIKNTTVASYLVISGIYNSQNLDNKISYELVSVPYNIEKELSTNKDNIELESYEEELRNGKYRDIEIVTRCRKI